jgi:hypothetical protein
MSEALRLSDSLCRMDTFTEYQRGEILKAATDLRRFAGVEAELQQAREERTALLVNEQNLREELAALRASLGEPRAFIRSWAFAGEKPAKERNANGRLAWPKKYLFVEISKHQVLTDDVPLFAIKDTK